jgi:hypothetical protein
MNDTTSDDVRHLGLSATTVGDGAGERVQSAIAAGQAQEMLAESRAASYAAGLADDAVDVGRRATRSVSRQIRGTPPIAVLAGFALGYLASSWFHRGGGRPVRKRRPGSA